LADFKDIRREGNSSCSCRRKSAKKKMGLETLFKTKGVINAKRERKRKKEKQTCTQRHLEIVRVRGT
jgi:hypothetical protein